MNYLAARARAVAAGEIAVGRAGEVLAARGVGSCVVVALYDPVARLGGLAHAMLPRRGSAGDRPLKYVDAAIERLLVELEAEGADCTRLVARLAGGAEMFRSELPSPATPVGERNLAAARAELARRHVLLVGEEAGGREGRSVFFDLATGKLVVCNLERDADS